MKSVTDALEYALLQLAAAKDLQVDHRLHFRIDEIMDQINRLIQDIDNDKVGSWI